MTVGKGEIGQGISHIYLSMDMHVQRPEKKFSERVGGGGSSMLRAPSETTLRRSLQATPGLILVVGAVGLGREKSSSMHRCVSAIICVGSALDLQSVPECCVVMPVRKWIVVVWPNVSQNRN